MSSNSHRDRFFLYPRPIKGPDVPYENPPRSNPRLRGWVLSVAAALLEWFGFLRMHAWTNAGFASLRKIQRHIEHTEPRFDPAVFPLENGDSETPVEEQVLSADEESKTPPPALSPNGKYSAAHYRALYLAGELTPLDVAKAILPLIRRDTQPPGQYSTAWFDVKVDIVLKAAEASTHRYREGQSLGPLDGVPTAVKDEYDMEGYITTLGSVNDYTGQEPHGDTIDTWCVRKLEEAGAIILGKLSMHEFGLDTSGNNINYGTPRNPYNPQYYTGGSSSGSAYAVAAGLVPIAMGSDGGGSIRIPSSFCSVFGLKTTHDRLSFLPGQNHSKTCGVNGPIAADMRSLAALYKVVSEPHPTSHFPPLPNTTTTAAAAAASPPGAKTPSRPKVIGIPEAWFARADPAIQTLCRGLVDRLVAEKGYTVVPITIPFLPEGQIAHAITVLADAATLLPDTRGISPANKILLALGRTTPSTDFVLAQKLRCTLMQHLAWLWQTHPGMVIVTPTTACAGWPIRGGTELRWGVSDGNQTMRTMEYVWMANFCGVPSLSVPAGFVVPEGNNRAGEVAKGEGVAGKVPVGLMATGEWAGEEELMAFGIDAEELGRGKQCRPPVWVDVVELARKEKVRSGE